VTSQRINFHKVRTAVFIDGSNTHRATVRLKVELQYDLLLQYLEEETQLVGAYFYSAIASDAQGGAPIRGLSTALAFMGYRLITKQTKGPMGDLKGNVDVEITTDMLKLAPHIDQLVLFSGDSDFCYALRHIQDLGVRVVVVSTTQSLLTSSRSDSNPTASKEIQMQADVFVDLVDLPAHLKIERADRSERGNNNNGGRN
jgi:uncharacterized LabA/DUF88 family protein